MEILAESTGTAFIYSAADKIDVTEWLFTLNDQEYQVCSSAHIACGASISTDGKRMSLNVEQVGESLLIQHYVEDISSRNHCRVNSVSDSISPAGRTTMGVTWELTVIKYTDNTCQLANKVVVWATQELLNMFKKANITNLEPVKQQMFAHLQAHNIEETPLFARDIEAKALAGMWP